MTDILDELRAARAHARAVADGNSALFEEEAPYLLDRTIAEIERLRLIRDMQQSLINALRPIDDKAMTD